MGGATSSSSSITGINPYTHIMQFNNKASRTDNGFYHYQSPNNNTSNFKNITMPNTFHSSGSGSPEVFSLGGSSGGINEKDKKHRQRKDGKRRRKHHKKDDLIKKLNESLLKKQEEIKIMH